MTLDEAIIYCEEIAERRAVTNDDLKCKREHRQLADWLKLLKRILDFGDCNPSAICKVSQVVPKWGKQFGYNCPMFERKEDES